jgi:hypothetical protein
MYRPLILNKLNKECNTFHYTDLLLCTVSSTLLCVIRRVCVSCQEKYYFSCTESNEILYEMVLLWCQRRDTQIAPSSLHRNKHLMIIYTQQKFKIAYLKLANLLISFRKKTAKVYCSCRYSYGYSSCLPITKDVNWGGGGIWNILLAA